MSQNRSDVMKFQNRSQAGREIARELGHLKGQEIVVYALPRGGVAVAAEVADALDAPLELVIARKIGHPMAAEYAIGAVTEHGQPVWNHAEMGFTEAVWRDRHIKAARAEAKRRRTAYQGDRVPTDPRGKIAVIVDDGIATGLTMIAAIKELRHLKPKSIVVAVPVAAAEARRRVARYADEVLAIYVPDGYFGAIGNFYLDFPQVEDEEVRATLQAYRPEPEEARPLDLEAINVVLAGVKHFPVTSGEIAARARRLHAPANVLNFFESIPREVEFADKADVMRRSEEAEILMEDEAAEPKEDLRSYD
jgi:predicted phosphoribosyltransferase